MYVHTYEHTLCAKPILVYFLHFTPPYTLSNLIDLVDHSRLGLVEYTLFLVRFSASAITAIQGNNIFAFRPRPLRDVHVPSTGSFF